MDNMNANANSSIGCSVASCTHNNTASRWCSLSSIKVACGDTSAVADAATKADTVCSSFMNKNNSGM